MKRNQINPTSINDWKYLGREIWTRTYRPFRNVPFVFYAILAIICLGGLGIWVELVKTEISNNPLNYEGVLTATSTFFPALIGSASLQLILTSTGNSDKVLVSFALLVCFLSFFGVVLISVFYSLHPSWSFNTAILFAAFSVWFWWFTNGEDLTYQSIPIDAATGGDTNRMLRGNLNEFKVD